MLKFTPQVGDMVHFFQNPSDSPSAAIVVRSSRISLNLVIFDRDGIWNRKEGVRHRDDPDLATNHNLAKLGCWDRRPDADDIPMPTSTRKPKKLESVETE